jgi:hypothetical protein
MRGMSWQDFEALLAMRGDRAGVRMYYLPLPRLNNEKRERQQWISLSTVGR